MAVSQPLDPDPKRASPGSVNRTFLAILGVGMLMGGTLTVLIGYLLWAAGFLFPVEAGCPQPGAPNCEPTALLAPTLETLDPALVAATPTPAPSSTTTPTPVIVTVVPDANATATAACAAFEAQFPGTPCPAP